MMYTVILYYKEIFYLMTHSTHFIYGYVVSLVLYVKSHQITSGREVGNI